MGRVKMDIYPAPVLGLSQLSLSAPLPLSSSVSIDIPGTVPEWVCWHLLDVHFTHCEYDRPGLAVGHLGVGWG